MLGSGIFSGSVISTFFSFCVGKTSKNPAKNSLYLHHNFLWKHFVDTDPPLLISSYL
jgi:hypothetical protein